MTDPIGKMQQEVKELADRLDRLTGYDQYVDWSDHGGRLDLLEAHIGHHSVRDLAATVDEIRESVDQLTGDDGAVAVAKRSLAERVRRIERHIRTSSQVPHADLDRWPDTCGKFAQAARRGRDAEDGLTPVWRYTNWQTTIAVPARLRTQIRAQYTSALTAARTLTTLGPGDSDRWKDAVGSWNDANNIRASLNGQLSTATEEAKAAEQLMTATGEQEAAAQRLVSAGQHALAGLFTRIRTRIAEAIRDDHLFPAWLETAVGTGPPADNAEGWLDTAVGVVAYRLINGIIDPVVALGERPDNRDSWQHREYRRLTTACQRFQL